LLFLATGIGNGSTFRMIPAIFRTLHQQRADAGLCTPAQAQIDARREAAAVIGICAAVGAFGGFLIPWRLGAEIKATGSVATAFGMFVVGYVLCAALTWWFYRRTAAMRHV
jgi:NNP family nitrate/nitrite transporter-like MFS transporter